MFNESEPNVTTFIFKKLSKALDLDKRLIWKQTTDFIRPLFYGLLHKKHPYSEKAENPCVHALCAIRKWNASNTHNSMLLYRLFCMAWIFLFKYCTLCNTHNTWWTNRFEAEAVQSATFLLVSTKNCIILTKIKLWLVITREKVAVGFISFSLIK